MTKKTINLVELNDPLGNINKATGNKLRSEDTVIEDLNEEDAEYIRQKETAANQLDQLMSKTEIKIFQQVALLHKQFANNCKAETVNNTQKTISQMSQLIERLSHYCTRKTFQGKHKNHEGVHISFRDIPKFQVQGHRVRHPKEPIFESISHYLSAIQKVLSAGRTPINQAWKTWLLVAFDHDHNTWYKQHLQGQDLNWEQVNLTPELVANVKLAWFACHNDMSQSVEQFLSLANIMAIAIKQKHTDPMEHITSTLESAFFGKNIDKNNLDKKNPFSLQTPIILQNEHKVIRLLDTRAERFCLDIHFYNNSIKLPIVKVEGYLVFAGKNQTSKRLGRTVLLEVAYANGHNFAHSFELIETNESDNDLILGQDIMPKLGITLAGVAIDWNTKSLDENK
ncbi:hypothetical protein PHYBLDRAFT_174695 [Phycomyces blakesleeanus NRRL 1555(-)]|uniref:Uncharacterized protein n=1 Tax=Phycomyces blakesleeanus (strain ATCC 8743b / DSM 1359 / FGSC 10004 / NBRC 33097 / NRRL 1555) TaxID=763407 RepID=A0A167JZQ2_PHYB8|nr:hypothetical protein PHYBLDRAFT_174695 [Phycomyces blakesleeanus NRRL 1555(-)]OAD66988.1 hypothetical protein PHYBLDRAFT_174695 [Phycomyces blakesleeanus NRRL 1555(-)]|eukprot:XP_018285028.1 hypothetical protein PHYBLDRAFT_174695 [Phycomyces blakesleeanus NRRL 1555(-)]